jgi:hypothetical protein
MSHSQLASAECRQRAKAGRVVRSTGVSDRTGSSAIAPVRRYRSGHGQPGALRFGTSRTP